MLVCFSLSVLSHRLKHDGKVLLALFHLWMVAWRHLKRDPSTCEEGIVKIYPPVHGRRMRNNMHKLKREIQIEFKEKTFT